MSRLVILGFWQYLIAADLQADAQFGRFAIFRSKSKRDYNLLTGVFHGVAGSIATKI